MRAHAKLSASGASRWMACTPSVRLENLFPQESSTYAQEGTLAHEIAETLLRRFLEHIDDDEMKNTVHRLMKNKLYSPAMDEPVAEYVAYCCERIEYARARYGDKTLTYIELRVNFAHIVPEGFGTGDVVIITPEYVEIIDLKFGQGVKVSAIGNPQLRLYGAGALRFASIIYDVPEVRMCIVQPRLAHISEEVLTTEELAAWAADEVAPRAAAAMAGTGEFAPGDHCKFCRAAPRCKALANENLRLTVFQFGSPDILSDEELKDAWLMGKRLADWHGKVSAYVMAEALRGRLPDGYKLVAGPARRRWRDEAAAADALMAMGIAETDYMNVKIKGIGDVSNLMPAQVFDENIATYIEKPPGAPLLVPESDKREPFGLAKAISDFS